MQPPRRRDWETIVFQPLVDRVHLFLALLHEPEVEASALGLPEERPEVITPALRKRGKRNGTAKKRLLSIM